MMAASVVDLPEPVGPVTRTNPRGLWQKECRTLGRPSSSMVLMLTGMSRKAAPACPRWKKALTRKRAWPYSE